MWSSALAVRCLPSLRRRGLHADGRGHARGHRGGGCVRALRLRPVRHRLRRRGFRADIVGGLHRSRADGRCRDTVLIDAAVGPHLIATALTAITAPTPAPAAAVALAAFGRRRIRARCRIDEALRRCRACQFFGARCGGIALGTGAAAVAALVRAFTSALSRAITPRRALIARRGVASGFGTRRTTFTALTPFTAATTPIAAVLAAVTATAATTLVAITTATTAFTTPTFALLAAACGQGRRSHRRNDRCRHRRRCRRTAEQPAHPAEEAAAGRRRRCRHGCRSHRRRYRRGGRRRRGRRRLVGQHALDQRFLLRLGPSRAA